MRGSEMKKNNRGFSLVELIVVIAIMAVLTVVLAPAYLRYVEKTRVQKDISAIGELVSAIKTSATNEEALDAIPSESKATATSADRVEADIYETLIAVEAETGVLETTTTLIGRENSRATLHSEVVKTVGNKIEFESDELQEKGLTLKVTKDDKYKIHVYLESYDYSDELRAKLVAYFALYESDDKIFVGICEDWAGQLKDILDNNGPVSGPLLALDKLSDLMFEKKEVPKTDACGNETGETEMVPDFEKPTEDGQKFLDKLSLEGDTAIDAIYETLKQYMDN